MNRFVWSRFVNWSASSEDAWSRGASAARARQRRPMPLAAGAERTAMRGQTPGVGCTTVIGWREESHRARYARYVPGGASLNSAISKPACLANSLPWRTKSSVGGEYGLCLGLWLRRRAACAGGRWPMAPTGPGREAGAVFSVLFVRARCHLARSSRIEAYSLPPPFPFHSQHL